MQLFEHPPEHRAVTMPLVTRLLATSKLTAGEAIALLIAAGILVKVGERKRDRIDRYRNYLQLLE